MVVIDALCDDKWDVICLLATLKKNPLGSFRFYLFDVKSMNKGFKFIIWTLSFMLFTQMVIPTSNVKAFGEESAMNEEKKVFLESVDTNTDIDILEVEQEFNEQFGEEIADEIVFNEVNETDEGIELDLGLESLDDDFHARVKFDSEASEFTASGEAIDENGKLNYYNYQVIVEESTEDSFVATFIDLNTEEVHRFDSNVAESSVLRAIIIGYVVRLGIQYVIKHVC